MAHMLRDDFVAYIIYWVRKVAREFLYQLEVKICFVYGSFKYGTCHQLKAQHEIITIVFVLKS